MRRGNSGMYNNSLNDLDRELNLLRRKRELLEQQQQLLNRESSHRSSVSPWDVPPTNYNDSGNRSFSSSNFVDMYGDPCDEPAPYYHQGGGGGGGRKRYSDNGWDNHTPKKRSNNRPQNNRPNRSFEQPSKFNGPSPRQSNPPPQRQRPRQQNTNAANRVAKPTNAPKPPNQMKKYPKPQRKQLVEAAVEATGKTQVKAPPEAEVLLADQEPSNAARGRMELVLGDVLKVIRQNHPRLGWRSSGHMMKEVKKSIRNRIRELLLGKLITTRAEMYQMYRDKYPDDDDIARVALSTNNAKRGVSVIAYCKGQAKAILSEQLTDMFSKIKKIYNGVDFASVQKELTDEVVEYQKLCLKMKLANPEEKQPNGESNPTEDNSIVVDQNDSTEINESDTKEKVDAANDENAKADEESAQNGSSDKIAEIQARIAEYSAEKLESILSRVVEMTIKKQLPNMITKCKDDIIEMVLTDENFLTARDNLLRSQGKSLVVVDPDAKTEAEDKAAEALREAKKIADAAKKPILYHVKVMGRPKLPKKEQLSQFLWKFNPLSIKKYRSIYNLLFVGLGTKEDYDNILAADETKFGAITLSIRHSERSKKPGEDNSNSESTADNPADKTNTDKTDTPVNPEQDDAVKNALLINSDLDKEITDLLDSIKDDGAKPSDGGEKATDQTKDIENEEEKANETVDTANETPKDNGTTEETPKNGEEKKDNEADGLETIAEEITNDGNVKESGEDKQEPVKATRASTRLANTPSKITTRRSSKLANN